MSKVLFTVFWNRNLDARTGERFKDRIKEILDRQQNDPGYGEEELKKLVRDQNPFPEWIRPWLEFALEHDPLNGWYYKQVEETEVHRLFLYIESVINLFQTKGAVDQDAVQRLISKLRTDLLYLCPRARGRFDWRKTLENREERAKELKEHLCAQSLLASPFFDDLEKDVKRGM